MAYFVLSWIRKKGGTTAALLPLSLASAAATTRAGITGTIVAAGANDGV